MLAYYHTFNNRELSVQPKKLDKKQRHLSSLFSLFKFPCCLIVTIFIPPPSWEEYVSHVAIYICLVPIGAQDDTIFLLFYLVTICLG